MPHAFQTIEALQGATYVPEDVLQQLRDGRDNTSTMVRESTFSLTCIEGEINVDSEPMSERDAELFESGARVFLGAFVAMHSKRGDDQKRLREAALDLSTQAFTDAHSASGAMELISHIANLGLLQSEFVASALQPCIEQANRLLPQLAATIHDMPVQELVELTSAVLDMGALIELPIRDAFISCAKDTILAFDAMYELQDPSLVSSGKLTHEQLVEMNRAGSAQWDVHKLAARLQGEIKQTPSVEATIAALQEGFTPQLLEQVIELLSSEFRQQEKRALAERFDDAIQASLEALAADHPLRQTHGLMEFWHEQMGWLAQFPSGRRFLAQKTRDYVGFVNEHIANPQLWLAKTEYPDYSAATFLRDIEAALWYNCDYYAAGFEDGTLHDAIEAATSIARFIVADNKSPGAAKILHRYAQSMEILAQWMGRSGRERRESVDPIYDLLASYRMQADG